MLNRRSVGGKTTAIHDRIVTDCLHLCAVVETWHDAVDSPHLMACTPPASRKHVSNRVNSAVVYADKSRRTVSVLRVVPLSSWSTTTSQQVWYGSSYCLLFIIKSYTKYKYYIRGAGRNALVVVIYRPPDTSISAFFGDLADIVERASTFACPVILMGDVNIHLDVVNDPHAGGTWLTVTASLNMWHRRLTNKDTLLTLFSLVLTAR